jgi:hypothetical protein
VPRHTAIRIEQLCSETKAAQTDGEAKGVLKELQKTLAEHIGLARESLEAQVNTLTALEAKANKKPRSRKPPQP